jgi:hypothetical protein
VNTFREWAKREFSSRLADELIERLKEEAGRLGCHWSDLDEQTVEDVRQHYFGDFAPE